MSPKAQLALISQTHSLSLKMPQSEFNWKKLYTEEPQYMRHLNAGIVANLCLNILSLIGLLLAFQMIFGIAGNLSQGVWSYH